MKFLTKAGPAGFLTKQGQVCLDVKFERYQVCWIGWDSPSGKVVCLSLRFRFIQLLSLMNFLVCVEGVMAYLKQTALLFFRSLWRGVRLR